MRELAKITDENFIDRARDEVLAGTFGMQTKRFLEFSHYISRIRKDVEPEIVKTLLRHRILILNLDTNKLEQNLDDDEDVPPSAVDDLNELVLSNFPHASANRM